MLFLHTAATLAADPTFDLNKGTAKIKGLLLVLVSFVLIYLTIKSLLGPGRSGDYNKSAAITGATLICMIPAALGLLGGAVALGYGAAVLRLFTGIFS
jgi:hypothetical protein